MKFAIFACAGLIALVACAADGTTDTAAPPTNTDSGQGNDDGGAPMSDGGSSEADAPNLAPDAERPLACSPTGVCETRLPTSELGEPLSLRSVWVVASNDVWSVSAEGLVLHHDGTSWTTSHRANHALYSVWGTATDVWAGGERGLLLHRSAGEWTRVETGHAQPIRAIYGTSAGDVWFSRGGAVDHFDGSKLTTLSPGTPGLRITTIFGRPGFGTYAAGYVERPVNLDTQTADHEPYVFELSPTAVSTFNSSLTGKAGFAPISGVATDAPDEDHRVLLFGYLDWNATLVPSYTVFGKNSSISVGRTGESPVSDFVNFAPRPPAFPAWARAWNDVRYVNEVGGFLRWDGTSFTRREIDMGYSFVPRTVFGVHGNSADMWIVGDGFALKGPTP